MEGIEILQNIEDKLGVEKCHGRVSDPLTDRTEYTKADDGANNVKEDDDDDTVNDNSFYCDE